MGESELNGEPIDLEELPAALGTFTESVNRFYWETKRRETKWKILVALNTVVMVAVVFGALLALRVQQATYQLQQDNHSILVLVEGAVGPEGLKRQQENQAAVVNELVQRTADEIERRLATKPTP